MPASNNRTSIKKPSESAVPAQTPVVAQSPAGDGAARVSLQQAMDLAQALRKQMRWQEAAGLYEKLSSALTRSPEAKIRAAVHHNHAVCLFALRQFAAAAEKSQLAYGLDNALWQSGVIEVNSLKQQGLNDAYVARALSLFEAHPEHAEVVLAAANATMNYLGDAASARRMIKPFTQHPTQGREVRILTLMSRLYDRDEDDTPEAISRDVCALAKADLQLTADEIAAVGSVDVSGLGLPVKRGRRVGVLCPMLSASPVHAFCFDTFRRLHEEGVELIFVSRGRTVDWATEQFRSVAAAWIDAVDYEPAALHVLLTELQLDELYEMGGWMDTAGLRAVSIKPCPRLVKWVGGQSCTTGLESFDAFISDEAQSPLATACLYSEPLLLQPSSYVSYCPPPYLANLANSANKGSGRWGVISNPLKLSRAFLAWLNTVGQQAHATLLPYGNTEDVPVQQLVLADQRYANPLVRKRVESVLRPVWGDRLQFEVPKGHVAFIETLAGLDGLIDTFPYSCGLTMVEALYVGLDVHFPPVERVLFCERHGWAHVVNHHAKTND